MRSVSLIAFLFISLSAFAQPTKEEILRNKIKKATETRLEENGNAEMTWYYDTTGADSMQIIFNETITIKTLRKNRVIVEQTYTNASGKETDIYTYEYKPDSSYKITHKENTFYSKSFEWYDKKGNIQKSQTANGQVINYVYTGRDKLILLIEEGKRESIKFKTQYSYNAKGQLSKVFTKDGRGTSTTIYTYGATGWLIKSVEKSVQDGEHFEDEKSWAYNDKGLPIKMIIHSKQGKPVSKSATINYEYAYEYY